MDTCDPTYLHTSISPMLLWIELTYFGSRLTEYGFCILHSVRAATTIVALSLVIVFRRFLNRLFRLNLVAIHASIIYIYT
jgi:hypothetical protein